MWLRHIWHLPNELILQESGLFVLPQFFFFWQNFFFFGPKFPLSSKLHLANFIFAKLHLANFIWQNFIWHRLALPRATLAGGIAFFKRHDKQTNKHTNKHTLAQLYYRYIDLLKTKLHALIIQNSGIHRPYNLSLAEHFHSLTCSFVKECSVHILSIIFYNI